MPREIAPPKVPTDRLCYAGVRYAQEDGQLTALLLAHDPTTGQLYAVDLWAESLTRPWLAAMWSRAVADALAAFRSLPPDLFHYLVYESGLAWRVWLAREPSFRWRPVEDAGEVAA